MISHPLGKGLLLLLLASAGPALAQRDTFPWFEKPLKPPVYPRILLGASALAERLRRPDVVVLDVRARSEYEREHVPGSLSFPDPPSPELLGERGLSGQDEVVLYGEPKDVGRAFLALEAAGVERVRVLDGGFDAWRVGRFPVETEARERSSRRFEASRKEPVEVGLPWLQARFGEPGVEVLDLRGGWGEGYEAPPDFSAGHVPHSLPFDPRTLLAGAGVLPRPAMARAKLGRLGPRPDTVVDLDATFVLYGKGEDDPGLGLGYLLLRLAGVDVRIFPGGWEEWARSPESPVVRIVSTPELEALLAREPAGPLLFFDLREEWDFRSGHIAGAYPLPSRRFAESLEPLVAERWPGIDRAQVPVVFYCYGRECIRSRECSTIAAKSGFRKLFWYREGMVAWQKEGRDVIVEPEGAGAGDVQRILEDAAGPKKPRG